MDGRRGGREGWDGDEMLARILLRVFSFWGNVGTTTAHVHSDKCVSLQKNYADQRGNKSLHDTDSSFFLKRSPPDIFKDTSNTLL